MEVSSNSKNSLAEKDAFPSSVELQVASSLLLLSAAFTITRSSREKGVVLGKKNFKKEEMKSKLKLKKKVVVAEGKNPLKFTISKSRLISPTVSSSTVTAGGSEGDGDQSAMVVSLVSKFQEMMKHKVTRKRRSKNISRKSSSSWSHEPSASLSASASASSCLSSGSSGAISSTASYSSDLINCKNQAASCLFYSPDSKKPVLGSHMRGRAEAILNILSSHGCASEVKIRKLLGDSPSTSKALRILLNLEQVTRSGGGGRNDPYVYTIA